MNFKNKLLIFFSFFLFIIPTYVLGYSDYVHLGGQNIGIEINFDGIMIVGFYDVNGKSLGSEAGLKLGDMIIKVEETKVSTIDEMIKIINKTSDSKINLTIKSNNNVFNTTLELIKKDGLYKTGLYVKDQIVGVGTLTYVDPKTNIFGSLGHEIVEGNTNTKITAKNGTIFKSKVTGITKSTKSTTGEKNATFYRNNVFGEVFKTTYSGVFGNYTSSLNTDLIEVGDKSDIEIGPAYIVTTLSNNEVSKYAINITKVNTKSATKNILFEIKDKELFSEANGIIKGMSGSPIIQNNKLIGAVTHAIVNDNTKGYGILIETMLEEGEK